MVGCDAPQRKRHLLGAAVCNGDARSALGACRMHGNKCAGAARAQPCGESARRRDRDRDIFGAVHAVTPPNPRDRPHHRWRGLAHLGHHRLVDHPDFCIFPVARTRLRSRATRRRHARAATRRRLPRAPVAAAGPLVRSPPTMSAPPLRNAGWGDVLENIDPFALASLGSTFALTLCVIGAAWCVCRRRRRCCLTRCFLAACCAREMNAVANVHWSRRWGGGHTRGGVAPRRRLWRQAAPIECTLRGRPPATGVPPAA